MPTTSKGFPYPSSSDNPNIPADFQALAQAIDTEFDNYSLTDANTTYHFEGTQHDSDDVDLELIGSDSSTDSVHFKAASGVTITWDELAQRITFGLDADLSAIASLAGTSGFLTKTSENTWALDTNTYSTTSHSHTLDGLSDVVISSATTGQVLKFNGTNWINSTDETGVGGSGNSFTSINTPDAVSVQADSATDTLTISVTGTGLSITGNASTDTITFALDADLQAIGALTGTSGFLKTNGSGTWTVDTATYITGSSPTITTPSLTLSTSTSTVDGRLAWDTTYHHAYIGDGTNLTLVPTFRVQTTPKTSAYTLVSSDANTLVQMNGAFAFTVPLNSATPYPVGTQIHLVALTTGASVTQSAGVTVNATPGKNFRAAYSSATLVKIGTDSWILFGDLSA